MTVFVATLFLACVIENDVVGPDPISVVPTPVPPTAVIRTEVFRQVAKPTVDVLWVVDDSESMEDESTRLADNFHVFLDWFLVSELDWHVGVISTNMEVADQKGKLAEADGYRWIDEHTENPEFVFGAMLPLYDGIDHDESGRQAVYTAVAVQDADYNSGFLREDSALHVVVISDENDHSIAPPKDEFIAWFSGLREGDNTHRSFSAVTVLEPCDDSYEVGQDYIDVTAAVGGVLRSICEPDWAPVLDAMGAQTTTLSTEFFLAEIPIDGTITVTVVEEDGDVVPQPEWTYDRPRNSVQFPTYVPPEQSVVTLTYTVRSASW